MDLNHFQETGVAPVGKDPDVLDFDSGLGYLYVASESGVVSVFRVRDRKMKKSAIIRLEKTRIRSR